MFKLILFTDLYSLIFLQNLLLLNTLTIELSYLVTKEVSQL